MDRKSGRYYQRKAEYSKGLLHQQAVYEFQIGNNQEIDVSIKWTDAPFRNYVCKKTYNTIPDGILREYTDPQIAHEVISAFESEYIMNSYTIRTGKPLPLLRESLIKRGHSKVIQGLDPQSEVYFENQISTTRRIANTNSKWYAIPSNCV